jgi:hypothetical protein
MDTGQSVPTVAIGGQPLIQMVTIDDVVPFRALICGAVISLMILWVFLILLIPISSLTPTSPIQGPSYDIVEPHSSIDLPITFRVTTGFRIIQIKFFIVGLMLPCDAIITLAVYQAPQISAPPSISLAPVPTMGPRLGHPTRRRAIMRGHHQHHVIYDHGAAGGGDHVGDGR